MRVLIFSFLFLVSASSRAGFRVGNGGVGLKVGGEILLLDFIEDSHFEMQTPSTIDPWMQSVSLTEIETQLRLPAQVLSATLSNIERRYPQVGRALALSMIQLKWKPVNDRLDSAGDLMGEAGYTNLVQIARRDGLNVSIDINSFRQMPLDHRIGLVVHESIYPFIRCAGLLPAICFSRSLVVVKKAVRAALAKTPSTDFDLYQEMGLSPAKSQSLFLLAFDTPIDSPEVYFFWKRGQNQLKEMVTRICERQFEGLMRFHRTLSLAPSFSLEPRLVAYNEKPQGSSVEKYSNIIQVDKGSCAHQLNRQLKEWTGSLRP